MASFAVVTLLVVVALWLYALKRRPGELDAARARRIQNRWIIGGGLVLPISSMALLLVFGIPIGYRKAERVCRAWIKSQDHPTPAALQHFLSYADPTGEKATRRADKTLRRTP